MKMPEAIAKSMTKVSAEVEGLVKDQDNNYAKYKFVSHDQIKMKVGKLMAKHGLIVVANETASEVRDKALHCEFEFWIYHESGVDYGPIRRTVQVPATGAQAYGTACSYAQKYFLRDIFQIPTGEQEDEATLPKLELVQMPKKPAITEKSSAKIRDELIEALNNCKTLSDLSKFLADHGSKKSLLSVADQELVSATYNMLNKNLSQPTAKEA
jgi:hypothetical protein